MINKGDYMNFENTGTLRDKAEKFDNISNVLVLSIEAELKTKIISAYLSGFYGTMYGGSPKNEKVLFMEGASIGRDGALWYVWGWPGPDYNTYKPQDYGKTWALTKEELIKL